MTIPCYINGENESDNVDYKDAFITLQANNQVSILDTSAYFIYTLGVGYAGVNYLFPTVTIQNFTKSYTLKFEGTSSSSKVSFEQIGGKIYVKTLSDDVYLSSFFITAVDSSNNIIDKIRCTLSLTNIGQGSFDIYCYEKHETYTENATISLYKNSIKEKTLKIKKAY